jgi:hypothetical protein
MTTLGNVFFTLELGNLLQHSTINDAHTWQRLFLIIPIALTIGGLAAIFLHKKTTDPSL